MKIKKKNIKKLIKKYQILKMFYLKLVEEENKKGKGNKDLAKINNWIDKQTIANEIIRDLKEIKFEGEMNKNECE